MTSSPSSSLTTIKVENSNCIGIIILLNNSKHVGWVTKKGLVGLARKTKHTAVGTADRWTMAGFLLYWRTPLLGRSKGGLCLKLEDVHSIN